MSHSTGAIRLFFIQFDLRNKLDGSENHLFYTWGIKDCETPKLKKKVYIFSNKNDLESDRKSVKYSSETKTESSFSETFWLIFSVCIYFFRIYFFCMYSVCIH